MRKLGLTPKPKDVDLLLDMLTYDYGAPDVIAPKTIAPGIVEFDTKKYDDFTVFDVNVKAGDTAEHCFSQEGPCVLLVHEGEGRISGVGEVSAGKVFYITPGTSVEKSHQNFEISCYHIHHANYFKSQINFCRESYLQVKFEPSQDMRMFVARASDRFFSASGHPNGK